MFMRFGKEHLVIFAVRQTAVFFAQLFDFGHHFFMVGGRGDLLGASRQLEIVEVWAPREKLLSVSKELANI